jgi:NADH:ubiquinone oxidoreductase subunit D
MKVVRFFHIRPAAGIKGKFNGATVLVVGDTEYPQQVDVQVATCSRKDMYCKKVGRTLAMKAPLKIVPLRYLSNELARIENGVYGYELDNTSDFLFAIRYFLPKE